MGMVMLLHQGIRVSGYQGNDFIFLYPDPGTASTYCVVMIGKRLIRWIKIDIYMVWCKTIYIDWINCSEMIRDLDLLDEIESRTESITINDLLEKLSKHKNIDLDPVYQRDVVWNEHKMSNFIDSLMRGFVPNNIIINIDSVNKKWICIDGKQRMTSIIKFFTNKLPWIRVTENPDQDNQENQEQAIYYNRTCIPSSDKKEDQNYLTLNKKQQQKFLNKKIIIVSYFDLDHAMQCEIFNRIQNSMASTAGEQSFSLFRNADVATKFKKFCRAHDYNNKARFKNVDIVMNIMYMQHIGEMKMLSGRAEKKKFIAKIDDPEIYDALIQKIGPELTIYFGEAFMGHRTMIEKKMTKNFVTLMFYLLSEKIKFTELKGLGFRVSKIRNMLIDIWNQWNIIDQEINKERAKTSKAVLEKIEKIYETKNHVIKKICGEIEDQGSDDSDDDPDSPGDDSDTGSVGDSDTGSGGVSDPDSDRDHGSGGVSDPDSDSDPDPAPEPDSDHDPATEPGIQSINDQDDHEQPMKRKKKIVNKINKMNNKQTITESKGVVPKRRVIIKR
jgi:hypothetical protein